MLLSVAPIGEVKRITAIWLEEDIKNSLEYFGVAIDSEVCVALKAYDDSFIIYINGNRVAIGEELAHKIMVI